MKDVMLCLHQPSQLHIKYKKFTSLLKADIPKKKRKTLSRNILHYKSQNNKKKILIPLLTWLRVSQFNFLAWNI